jgi:hypothetical protein
LLSASIGAPVADRRWNSAFSPSVTKNEQRACSATRRS